MNFCGFEWLWFVFLWFPPRFPAPLHLLYRVYVSLGVCSVGKPRCIAEYCRPRSHAVEHLCLCFAQVVGTTHLAPPSLAGFQQPSGSALVSFPRFLGGVPDSVRGSEPGRGGLGALTVKTATATRIVEVQRLEYVLIQIFTDCMDRFGWLPFMPPEHGQPAYGVPCSFPLSL